MIKKQLESISNEDLLNHYQKQSQMTDPKEFGFLYDDLPNDPREIIEIVGELLLNFQTDIDIPPEQIQKKRKHEIDLRYASSILKKIIQLNNKPLTTPRSQDEKLLSTCRDSALILCSIMRAKGIPSRLRFGFTNYLYNPNNPMHDHVLVEYWDYKKKDWYYCDARVSKKNRVRFNLNDFDPIRIPRDLFITAGQIWNRCRHGADNAKQYSGIKLSEEYGLWNIRNFMMYDIAGLFGFEPLIWDSWGFMLISKIGKAPVNWYELMLLDKVSGLDPNDPLQWIQLQKDFRRIKGIKVPPLVHAFSPLNGHYCIEWDLEDGNKSRLYRFVVKTHNFISLFSFLISRFIMSSFMVFKIKRTF